MGAWELPDLPRDPIPLDEAIALFPTVRQSLLAPFDDCRLSALFKMRYANGWSTHPAARGIIMHRAYAEALRRMKKLDQNRIEVGEALEILTWALEQDGIPLIDRVRVPLREIRDMRIEMKKWAADNRFTVKDIVDIERRLEAKVCYDGPDGRRRERVLSGQLDVLLFQPPEGAVVLDWKSSYALPPQDMGGEGGYEDDGSHVSYGGYFQQRFYGLLVMKKYPAVNVVTLREFYPRKTKVREARIHRVDLEKVEEELGLLVRDFDLTVAAGTRDAGTLEEDDAWRPSAGQHCSLCVKAGRCPIEREARGDGAVTSLEQARTYAAELQVAKRVQKHRWEALKAYCRVHGDVPVRSAKGRRVVGFRERTEQTRNGPRVKSIFGLWTPDTSDRGNRAEDLHLEEAMRAAVTETKRLREGAAA